jgi:hypothetical protein
MESGAQVEDAHEASAADGDAALVGQADAADQAQERGLAGAVVADDAEDAAPVDFEGDVSQCPERGAGPHPLQAAKKRFLDGPWPIGSVSTEALADTVDDDGLHRYSSSAK